MGKGPQDPRALKQTRPTLKGVAGKLSACPLSANSGRLDCLLREL